MLEELKGAAVAAHARPIIPPKLPEDEELEREREKEKERQREKERERQKEREREKEKEREREERERAKQEEWGRDREVPRSERREPPLPPPRRHSNAEVCFSVRV